MHMHVHMHMYMHLRVSFWYARTLGHRCSTTTTGGERERKGKCNHVFSPEFFKEQLIFDELGNIKIHGLNVVLGILAHLQECLFRHCTVVCSTRQQQRPHLQNAAFLREQKDTRIPSKQRFQLSFLRRSHHGVLTASSMDHTHTHTKTPETVSC